VTDEVERPVQRTHAIYRDRHLSRERARKRDHFDRPALPVGDVHERQEVSVAGSDDKNCWAGCRRNRESSLGDQFGIYGFLTVGRVSIMGEIKTIDVDVN